MAAKQEIFVPTEQEIEWVKGLLNFVQVGSVWVSKYVIYKRVDDAEFHCIYIPHPTKNPIHLAEREIFRVKTICEAIGIKFVDKRPLNN